MVRRMGHVRMQGFKQFEARNHPNELKYWVGGLAHANSRLKSQLCKYTLYLKDLKCTFLDLSVGHVVRTK